MAVELTAGLAVGLRQRPLRLAREVLDEVARRLDRVDRADALARVVVLAHVARGARAISRELVLVPVPAVGERRAQRAAREALGPGDVLRPVVDARQHGGRRR